MSTTNGFQDTEIGPIPIDWALVHLEDTATDFYSGGTPSTKRPDYYDGSIPFTTSAYIDQALYLREGFRTISEEGLRNSSARLAPAGSLLVGTRVGVGKVAINLVDMAISQDLTAVLPDKTTVHTEFLAYMLRSDVAQSHFEANKRGTTIKGITRDDLRHTLIPLPPLPEQRRIAHVLSTVQSAIAAQYNVITAARELNLSLMKRLFTYGPHEELSETRDAEEHLLEIPADWPLSTVGEHTEMRYGYQTSIPKQPPENGVPIISTAELTPEGLLDWSAIRTVEVPEHLVDRYTVRVGDLLFNWRNSQQHVGKTALVEDAPNEPTIYASFIIRLRPREDLNIRYLHYLLKYLRYQRIFFTLSRRAVNQANFNANELGALRIPLPEMFTQGLTASYLDGSERRIAVEQRRKSALKALFRSLLNNLMTGRIRTDEADLAIG